MRSLIISRNSDVLTGLRLAGIKGVFVKSEEELKREFDKNLNDYGIIILTEDDFNVLKERVIDVKLNRKLPLVVTIPGINGLKDKDFILKYIKESIGVKI